MLSPQSQKVANRLFTALQLLFLIVTYGFLYTVFIATQLAIEKLNISSVILLPTIFLFFLYLYVLYRCKKIYNRGRATLAIGWMTTLSFIIILLPYYLLAKIMNV